MCAGVEGPGSYEVISCQRDAMFKPSSLMEACSDAQQLVLNKSFPNVGKINSTRIYKRQRSS